MKTYKIPLIVGGLLAAASVAASAASVTFSSAEGWTDGNSEGQTGGGLGVINSQDFGSSDAFQINTTTGTLSAPSQQFLRATFGVDDGMGTPVAFDIPEGGSATVSFSFGFDGNTAAGNTTNNRILGEFGVINTPGNPVGGSGDGAGTTGLGIQVVSNGTNYAIDPGGFNGGQGQQDTGVTVLSDLTVSLVYSEASATSTLLEVFVNGGATPIYTETQTNGATAGNIAAWVNTSQGLRGGANPNPADTFLRIDSLEIDVVPEPSTALLGLLGLGLVARRRR